MLTPQPPGSVSWGLLPLQASASGSQLLCSCDAKLASLVSLDGRDGQRAVFLGCVLLYFLSLFFSISMAPIVMDAIAQLITLLIMGRARCRFPKPLPQ